jgi:hypothetical protein
MHFNNAILVTQDFSDNMYVRDAESFLELSTWGLQNYTVNRNIIYIYIYVSSDQLI